LTETPEIPQATRTTRIPTKPKDLWTEYTDLSCSQASSV
jgi:hypothetical protein